MNLDAWIDLHIGSPVYRFLQIPEKQVPKLKEHISDVTSQAIGAVALAALFQAIPFGLATQIALTCGAAVALKIFTSKNEPINYHFPSSLIGAFALTVRHQTMIPLSAYSVYLFSRAVTGAYRA